MKIIFLLLSLCLSTAGFAQFDPEIQKEILVWSYYDQGNALFAVGEYEQAIDAYSRAVQLDPDFALAHYNMGNAYMGLVKSENDFESLALDNYLKALELDPYLSRAPLPNIRVVGDQLVECKNRVFVYFEKVETDNRGVFLKRVNSRESYRKKFIWSRAEGQDSNPCNDRYIDDFMRWFCFEHDVRMVVKQEREKAQACTDIPYTGSAKTKL